MKALNSEMLATFLQLAGQRLQGDWVLLGGNVLPLLGLAVRNTYDIDFVALSKEQANNSLQLMQLADELNWPLETINQSAIVYLWKIPDYGDHLILLEETEQARIYRPNIWLFIQLKIKRLNPGDLDDCLAFVDYARNQADEPFPREDLRTLLDETIAQTTNNDPKLRRLIQLAQKLI